jgi:PadR family transcriptional regulator PadR
MKLLRISEKPFLTVLILKIKKGVEKDFTEKWTGQIKKGLLIFLVMNVIKRKNSYGYEIIQEINKSTGITMADGTLYPILKKLKSEKLVLTRWDVQENTPPRKYYYLTGTGNAVLKEMKEYWTNLSDSIKLFAQD